LAQLAAAGVIWLGVAAIPPAGSMLLAYGLGSFVVASVFWAILNLVPVLPLDGGRIAIAMAGPRNARAALGLGVACAVGLAVFMGLRGSWIAAILFGVLAYNNVQQLRGARQVPLMGVHPR
jgi:Zn-dependent protease